MPLQLKGERTKYIAERKLEGRENSPMAFILGDVDLVTYEI